VEQGVWLSFFCVAGSAPYVYHSYFIRFSSVIEGKIAGFDTSWMLSVITGFDVPVYQFMIRDMVLIFLACLLCGTCGFAWAASRGLAGLGSLRDGKKDLLRIVGWALVFDVVMFLVLDRPLAVKMPFLYPSTVAGLVVLMLKSACFEELIFRFGFLTLLYRLYPNRHVAVLLSSLLFAFAAVKTFSFLGLDYGFNYLTALSFATRLASGLALGYVYVYKGLYPVMFFRMLLVARLVFLI
jgi:hypothetical protein